MCLKVEKLLNLHFRDEFTPSFYQFFTRATFYLQAKTVWAEKRSYFLILSCHILFF